MQDWAGRTPLHYIYQFRLEKETVTRESISQLLEAGADVNARDREGNTPLSMSICWRGGAQVTRLLIESGASVNSICYHERPIHWAAEAGDAEIVHLLLNAGAKANAIDMEGKNALHHAVRATDYRNVMLRLFEASVNVNASDKEGMTPMHELLAYFTPPDADVGTFGKAQLLIDNGANIDALNKCGQTPLFMVFARRFDAYYGVYMLYISPHASGERRRRELCSWPWFVANGARLDVVAHIEQSTGDDLLDKCIGLFTFAHFAVFNDDVELLKAAIAHGVDLNVRSKSHGSALHMACDENNGTLAKMLHENGAHVDIVSLSIWQRIGLPFAFDCLKRFFACCQMQPPVDAEGRDVREKLVKLLRDETVKEDRGTFGSCRA